MNVFATEDIPLSDLYFYIQILHIMYYTYKFVLHPFKGQTFQRNTTFCIN